MRVYSTLLCIILYLMPIGLIQAQQWTEVSKYTSSDRNTGDELGVGVAIDGGYAIVGAPYDDEDAFGGNYLEDAGSAYVLINIDGAWTEYQKIVPETRIENANFGSSVHISGDYLIVGAYTETNVVQGDSLYQAGAAYIFKNISGSWTQIKKITASDEDSEDWFGLDVKISIEFAFVAAFQEDHNPVGNDSINAAGSVYIFRNDDDNWSQMQKIVAEDRDPGAGFGSSLDYNGDFLIIGAVGEEKDENYGNSIENAGAAYIFQLNNGNWIQFQKLVASDRAYFDLFGWDVAINDDYAIISATYESGDNSIQECGSVYIFEYVSGQFDEIQKIGASDPFIQDHFGWSLDISDEKIIVGACHESEDENGSNQMFQSGSAYIFTQENNSWIELQKIVATDRNMFDWFGFNVGIDNSYAIVGATLEDEDVLGNNTLMDAGSIYFFADPDVGFQENHEIRETNAYYVNGNLFVHSGVGIQGEISLIDCSGREVLRSKMSGKSNIFPVNYPSGIYTLMIFDNGKLVLTKKIWIP